MTGKKTKYGSRRIPACPKCWGPMMYNDKYIMGSSLVCANAMCAWYDIADTNFTLVYFMSKNEANIGFHLKSLELRGKIRELKMQESFELLNVTWDAAIEADIDQINKLQDLKLYNKQIPTPYNHYKSDFTFIDITGNKRVIEVKGDCKKNIKNRGILPDGKKYRFITKENYPYFSREQPSSQFTLKSKLMFLIHGLNVEVWTPKRRFVFDTTWKLQEVGGVRI